MLSIIIAHANLQRMVAFYAHISQRAWTGHTSFNLNIPLNGQRLWSYGFTRCVSFNVPDPGTIWDGTVHALRPHRVPPCLLFILDRQRKLTVLHRYIYFTHTPLFHCTVHNFGCFMRESSMESSAMWARDDSVTPSLASVILHACCEFCVRLWYCPLVRYDNANMIDIKTT